MQSFIKHTIFALSAWSSLIGTGLLCFGLYTSISSETNQDLYSIGGLLALVGISIASLIIVFFKKSDASVIDYTLSALFWSL